MADSSNYHQDLNQKMTMKLRGIMREPVSYTHLDVYKRQLAGLTRISDIQSFIREGDELVPCEGKLFYRGINIKDIVKGFIQEKRFGFEEVVYLLLTGDMPDKAQLSNFQKLLAHYRTLPTNFVRDIIMKAPSADTVSYTHLFFYGY